MKLGSSNGTQKTIKDMRKAWNLLHECCLRIQKINDGSYNQNPPIQFDYVTCPELSNWTDNLNDIMKKIDKVVSDASEDKRRIDMKI